jgi:hypothetical protein
MNSILAYYIRIIGYIGISQSAEKEQTYNYVILLTNFLQINLIIFSFSPILPDSVLYIQELFANPSQLMYYALDCQLKYYSLRASTTRLIWTLSIQVLVLISSFLILSILKLLKVCQHEFKFLSLLFAIIFLYQYFGIYLLFLSALGCTKIGDDYYLISNTTIKCKY